MKKLIALVCFAALLLSTSSLNYFYWLQEKLHEQERFASIDAGKFHLNNIGSNESKQYSKEDSKEYSKEDSKEDSKEYRSEDSFEHSGDQITILVKHKTVLPEGYQWEEKGREFSYKGMFYDIVSIKKTKEGWVIKAASDEEEASIVANQHTLNHVKKEAASKSTSSKIKLNLSLVVYEFHTDNKPHLINKILLKKKYRTFAASILSSYSRVITQPPEIV